MPTFNERKLAAAVEAFDEFLAHAGIESPDEITGDETFYSNAVADAAVCARELADNAASAMGHAATMIRQENRGEGDLAEAAEAMKNATECMEYAHRANCILGAIYAHVADCML